MRISIKQTLVIALLSLGFTYQANAASATPVTAQAVKAVTILNEIKAIQKIEVSGNVEVFLVQSADEKVKVYDNYYSKNALVQNQNGVLRISSFEKETLKVAVYVKSLKSIQLNDNSKLSTSGQVSFLSLDVQLNGAAQADIFANTIQLTSTVRDNAKLNLSGQSNEFKASLGTVAQLNMNQFKSETLAVNSINKSIYAKVPTGPKSISDVRILMAEDTGK